MNNQMANSILQSISNNNQLMSNHIFSNAFNAYRNHDSRTLRQIAENLCRENGTTFDEQRKRIGL